MDKKEPKYIRGKYTSAAKEATKRYQAKTYDEIKVRVPKGNKALLQKFASNHNYSLNALFNAAVDLLIMEIETGRYQESLNYIPEDEKD